MNANIVRRVGPECACGSEMYEARVVPGEAPLANLGSRIGWYCEICGDPMGPGPRNAADLPTLYPSEERA